MKNLRFAAAVALLTGCSLINSLDSVKSQAGNDGGGEGGKAGNKGAGGSEPDAGAGGTSGESGAGGASSGGAAGLDAGMEAGLDASEDGGGGLPDSGTDGGKDAGPDGGGFVPGGPGGAIVVYDTTGKLYVFDPQDGHPISSEASPRVLAIANDPFTDVWYLFVQPGTVFSQAQLEVRQLNTTTGMWRNVAQPIPVPNPALPTIGMLHQRIAYLSTPDPKSPDFSSSALTVLDSSKPGAVTVINPATRALPPGGKLALIANPDGANVGGSATVVLQSACGASECDVNLLRETINATTVLEESTPKKIGSVNPTGGGIGVAYDYANRYDVLLMPPLTVPQPAPTMCTQGTGTTGSAVEFDPVTHNALVGPFDFDLGGYRVSAAAFDSCHKIAFATSLLGDTAIWSIPMAMGGTPQKLCTIAGGAMLFEPYTHAVLRVPPAGDRMEIYDIDEKDPLAPKLVARNLKLPAALSLKGAVMAVRQPLSGFCK